MSRSANAIGRRPTDPGVARARLHRRDTAAGGAQAKPGFRDVRGERLAEAGRELTFGMPADIQEKPCGHERFDAIAESVAAACELLVGIRSGNGTGIGGELTLAAATIACVNSFKPMPRFA